MLWVNFILGSIFCCCFIFIIIHQHRKKQSEQSKIKIEPRIKIELQHLQHDSPASVEFFKKTWNKNIFAFHGDHMWIWLLIWWWSLNSGIAFSCVSRAANCTAIIIRNTSRILFLFCSFETIAICLLFNLHPTWFLQSSNMTMFNTVDSIYKWR